MINENLVFGIDLGIGSCGWAVLKRSANDDNRGSILALGSWCFDVPETGKKRTPKNQIQRANRLLRRVIRRRRQRMAEIRQLFHSAALLSTADKDALKRAGLDPWELRARGLDKPLRPIEFAVALGHIAKHRGFKLAAKGKKTNKSDDDKKMLIALEKNQTLLARYRTVGEMFARDPDFSARRRNRNGIFDRTSSRDDLIYEVKKLFSAQRRLGQEFATTDLEEVFSTIAFRQLPLQDSEALVGYCPFERSEKRSSKFSPSFEEFRLLTRLINLKIKTVDAERSLTTDELMLIAGEVGKTKKISFKRVRKLIGLAEAERFNSIKPDEEGRDIAVRTGDATPGTYIFRKVLGELLWTEMRRQPQKLDETAYILSFFNLNETIIEKLSHIGLPQNVLDALIAGLEAGEFSDFKGAANLSAKACRNLLPHLQAGNKYDEACQLAGYNHAESKSLDQEQVLNKKQFNELTAEVGEDMANPIARKAMTEGLKQIWALRNRYGLPGAIHIELARDVGHSLEKRQEIEKDINEKTAQRDRERKEAAGQLNCETADINSTTLLRYRLWKEQSGECLYTGKAIHPMQIIATDNSMQVDHILPWSRFNDDSFNNKTLCFANANQKKSDQTPYEWFQAEKTPEEWETFVQRIETNKELKGIKKRNFLLKNAAEAEKKFRSRNLNDTRYAARALIDAAKRLYPIGDRQEKDGRRRVFTRPGALTAVLRKAWGLESLKKQNGKRVNDDRHHALDALTVAAVDEAEVQRLTKAFQEWERTGLGRSLRYVDPPWEGFRNDVLAAYETIFVARPERRRGRGEGHEATIKQIKKYGENTIIFERKDITTLTETDLKRIKDPESNKKIIDAIRVWMAAGSPKDNLPRSPQGDIITKIRLETTDKPAVSVRGGNAARGDMVRIDVFSKPNKKGKDEWYLIPIYPHQVMNKKSWPRAPDRAVVGNKAEAEWTQIDASYKFCFSLYPRSYIEIIQKTEEVFSGYFSGLDRSTGKIKFFPPHDPTDPKGYGAKTLLKIKKFNIDRFGQQSEIKKEVRTWHGAVCTFPSLPG